jgi:hypothetical protein
MITRLSKPQVKHKAGINAKRKQLRRDVANKQKLRFYIG